MDMPSRERWYDYSRARDAMLEATDIEAAPWHIVWSDDQKRARLNYIAHFLSLIPCEQVPRDKVKLPNRSKRAPTTTRFRWRAGASSRRNTRHHSPFPAARSSESFARLRP